MRNELSSMLGLTPDGIKYQLQKMTSEGIITRQDWVQSGYWEVMVIR